jgi:hypothetical protein
VGVGVGVGGRTILPVIVLNAGPVGPVKFTSVVNCANEDVGGRLLALTAPRALSANELVVGIPSGWYLIGINYPPNNFPQNHRLIFVNTGHM